MRICAFFLLLHAAVVLEGTEALCRKPISAIAGVQSGPDADGNGPSPAGRRRVGTIEYGRKAVVAAMGKRGNAIDGQKLLDAYVKDVLGEMDRQGILALPATTTYGKRKIFVLSLDGVRIDGSDTARLYGEVAGSMGLKKIYFRLFGRRAHFDSLESSIVLPFEAMIEMLQGRVHEDALHEFIHVAFERRRALPDSTKPTLFDHRFSTVFGRRFQSPRNYSIGGGVSYLRYINMEEFYTFANGLFHLLRKSSGAFDEDKKDLWVSDIHRHIIWLMFFSKNIASASSEMSQNLSSVLFSANRMNFPAGRLIAHLWMSKEEGIGVYERPATFVGRVLAGLSIGGPKPAGRVVVSKARRILEDIRHFSSQVYDRIEEIQNVIGADQRGIEDIDEAGRRVRQLLRFMEREGGLEGGEGGKLMGALIDKLSGGYP